MLCYFILHSPCLKFMSNFFIRYCILSCIFLLRRSNFISGDLILSLLLKIHGSRSDNRTEAALTAASQPVSLATFMFHVLFTAAYSQCYSLRQQISGHVTKFKNLPNCVTHYVRLSTRFMLPVPYDQLLPSDQCS
jgi:hypothetical protein